MNLPDEAVTIFSCLHDGSIEVWTGNFRKLRLEISCEYLATLVDPRFTRFFVELEDIHHLELECWTLDQRPRILTDLPEVLRGQLEITSAEDAHEGILITCYQRDPDLDYVGGNLRLQCRNVRVFDEANTEYTAAALSEISDRYWENFANQQHGLRP